MDFHLVDHGADPGKAGQIHQPVGVEVGYADGPQFAFVVEVFQGAVGAIVIAKRLVEQHQIQIICL